MKVKVQLFAVARQRAGRESIELDLADGATIAALGRALVEHCPALATILPASRWAINSEYASEQQQIPTAAEIALIPPVSGG